MSWRHKNRENRKEQIIRYKKNFSIFPEWKDLNIQKIPSHKEWGKTHIKIHDCNTLGDQRQSFRRGGENSCIRSRIRAALNFPRAKQELCQIAVRSCQHVILYILLYVLWYRETYFIHAQWQRTIHFNIM